MTRERKKHLREMAEKELASGSTRGVCEVIVELLDALDEAETEVVRLSCGRIL